MCLIMYSLRASLYNTIEIPWYLPEVTFQQQMFIPRYVIHVLTGSQYQSSAKACGGDRLQSNTVQCSSSLGGFLSHHTKTK